jgi:hypothetical protein
MKRVIHLSRIAITIALIVGATDLGAADKTNNASDEVPARSTGALSARAWERQVREINWDGLPLGEIVRTLRHEFPEVNFVVTSKVQSDTIRMFLRNVTLEDIFKALEPAAEGRVRVTWNREDRLVIFDKPPAPSTGLPDPPICRVFNISKFLAGKEGKDAEAAMKSIAEAVQGAWTMLREASEIENEPVPRVSLHPGANLLIVVGRVQEVNVVEELVKELQGSAPAHTVPVPVDAQREGKSKPNAPSLPAPKQ